MIKKINTGKCEALYIKCVPVTNVEDPIVKEWAQHLKDTFTNVYNQCNALSINQIWDNDGPMPSMIIARLPGKDEAQVMMNTVCAGTGRTLNEIESCVSFPNKKPKKRHRAKNLTILYMNEKGEKESMKMGQPYSSTLAHHVDHVNGRCLYHVV